METDPMQPFIGKHTTGLTRPHRWIFRVQTQSEKPESPTGCSPDSMKKWSALLPELESQDYWTAVTCPVHRWWFFRVKEWKTRKTCGFLRVPNFQALTMCGQIGRNVLNLNLGTTKKTKSLFLFDQLSFQSVVIRPIKHFFSVPVKIADDNSKIGRKVPKHILFEHFVLQCEVASPGSQTVWLKHHTTQPPWCIDPSVTKLIYFIEI